MPAADLMGTEIVCLHGFGSSSDVFNDLKMAPTLAGHSFIIPDHAGYRKALQDLYTGDPLQFAADKLVASLKANKRKVMLIGHSMGSAIALLVAKHAPEFVAALVSMEGSLTGGKLTQMIAATTDDDDLIRKRDALRRWATETGNAGWRAWGQDVQAVTPEVLRDYAASLVKLCESGELVNIFNTYEGPKAYLYSDAYDPAGLNCLEVVRRHHIPGVNGQRSDHFVMQDNPIGCAAVIRDTASVY